MIISAFATDGRPRTPPQFLTTWQEAVGTLHRLTSDEGSLVAEIGPVAVFLPSEFEEELRPYIGMRVGILRTDDPSRPYRTRTHDQ